MNITTACSGSPVAPAEAGWKKDMKIPDLSRRFVCNHCSRKTLHWPISSGAVGKEPIKGKGNEYSYQSFNVMECPDCKSVTLCIDTRIHPGSGDSYIEKTDYYPPRLTRERPSWFRKIDPQLKKLLEEIYKALDCSLLFVASIGIRTVLDKMIVDRIGDVGSFKNKVNRLEEKGIIDSEEKELLFAIIDVGSASAHRGFKPTKKIITQMTDIMERMLYRIYIESKEKALLLKKAGIIRKQTPQKKKQDR
jgi:hypothetical protein